MRKQPPAQNEREVEPLIIEVYDSYSIYIAITGLDPESADDEINIVDKIPGKKPKVYTFRGKSEALQTKKLAGYEGAGRTLEISAPPFSDGTPRPVNESQDILKAQQRRKYVRCLYVHARRNIVISAAILVQQA